MNRFNFWGSVLKLFLQRTIATKGTRAINGWALKMFSDWNVHSHKVLVN